jgi:hypothetical protein
VRGRPTRSDEFRDVAVAGHFPMGNLLNGAVDGVEEGFYFWRSLGHSCLLGGVLIEGEGVGVGREVVGVEVDIKSRYHV